MAHDIMKIEDGVVYIRISELMRLTDLKALQDLAQDLIRTSGQFRLLAILDGFQGWERNEAWSETGFLAEQGDTIQKMAIIGDEVWKEEVFLFTGKGFRATEIEFFPPSSRDEAERWVRA
jgi:hypothetical protein